MRLFNRINSRLLPVVTFFLILLAVIIRQMQKENIIVHIEQNLDAIATLHEERINDHLQYIEERMLSFNSRLLLRRILAKYPDGKVKKSEFSQLQKIVLQTHGIISSFEKIYVVSARGVIAASTEVNNIGAKFADTSILSEAVHKNVIGHIAINGENKVILTNAISLRYEKEVVGYLVVRNNAKQIFELARSRVGLGATGESYLVARLNDEVGTSISPLRFSDQQNTSIKFSLSSLESSISNAALASRENKIVRGVDYRNVEVFSSTRHLSRTGWGLVVKIDTSEALAPLANLELTILISSLVFLVFMVSASVLLAKSISSPIELMARTAKNIEQGASHETFSNCKILELDELSRIFNDMTRNLKNLNKNLEVKVEERTGELEKANEELQVSLKDLKQAQSRLVESEKMASLGGLVAGIAHEVNTPIGAGLSAVTFLQKEVKVVLDLYSNGNLTEGDFEGFLSSGKNSTEIILNNLSRAADLIRSFKRVAVDQSNEQPMEFELVEYVRDILMSLKPKYKNKNLEFNFKGCEKLVVTLVPGAVAQIFSNLIINSIVHGFEEMEAGQVNIHIEVDGGKVVLAFEDNGVGMSPAVVQKIFNPFFTTKRGQGGSGLGMHIVYNIVTQTLKGEINVSSDLGKGSQFTIRFPKNIVSS